MNKQLPLLFGLLLGLVFGYGMVYYFSGLSQEQANQEVATDAHETITDHAESHPAGEHTHVHSHDHFRVDSVPPSADWTGLFHPRYVMGKFTAEDHPDIVAVPNELTDGDGGYFLHKRALDSFIVMHAAAKADGIKLEIVSAFRNFDRQKAIWEAKWTGKRLLEGKENASKVYPDPAERARAILRYSSMPGSSRHHWGTDLDLNNLNNSYFASGEGLKVYEWLQDNAAQYGFCQPYTEKGELRPDGYEEEKWHWSFMPLSAKLTAFAQQELKDEDIEGFAGAESAPLIGVVEKYVLGINPVCW